MAEARSAKPREREAVLVLPDIGLKKTEIDSMRKRFENSLVESLGGRDALARRAVIVVVVVVIVKA